jgi:hypothetical protein
LVYDEPLDAQHLNAPMQCMLNDNIWLRISHTPRRRKPIPQTEIP